MTYVFVEIVKMYWILNELYDEYLHLQFTRSELKINQKVCVLTKLYPLSILTILYYSVICYHVMFGSLLENCSNLRSLQDAD